MLVDSRVDRVTQEVTAIATEYRDYAASFTVSVGQPQIQNVFESL